MALRKILFRFEASLLIAQIKHSLQTPPLLSNQYLFNIQYIARCY